MNREIKFRVWAPDHKKMIYPLDREGHVEGLYSSCRHHTQPFIFEMTLCGRIFVSQCCGEKGFKDDYVLEQYTGIKDKNGKEIYEGDIIRDENNNLCEIYYYQPDGAWVTFPLKWSFDAYTFFSAFYSLNSYSLNSKRVVEVIGNVHENPELLNENGQKT